MEDESYLDQTWIIWNSFYGVHVRVTIGEVEESSEGIQIWLDEPYDMVGPLDLEKLLAKGKIHFAECIVLSFEQWQIEQRDLQRESVRVRRAAEERISKKYQHYNSGNNQQTQHFHQFSDKKHRVSFNLPATGELQAKQIKAAFRKLAQKFHPDTGGDHEQFVKITKARDILLQRAS